MVEQLPDMQNLNVIIQAMTVFVLAILFFAVSLAWLRKRHMGERVAATRFGALLYAIIFASFVGLVLVPLRMEMMNEGGAEDTAMFTKYLPAFAFFILIIRSDVTGRLPLIGTFIRAYRTAMLRRTIEGAQKRLDKMAALDMRATTGA